MMRGVRTAVVLAALGAALALPGQAAANHTLAHKVQALTAKVNAINAKLNCIQKFPVHAFGDYAYQPLIESGSAVEFETEAELEVLIPPVETITALDFDYPWRAGVTDAFFLGVRPTTSCRAKFALAANPVTAMRLTTAKLGRLE